MINIIEDCEINGTRTQYVEIPEDDLREIKADISIMRDLNSAIHAKNIQKHNITKNGINYLLLFDGQNKLITDKKYNAPIVLILTEDRILKLLKMDV